MFLKKLELVKYGPVEEATISLESKAASQPRNLCLLGVNGSGKSLAISVILDGLAQVRSHAFPSTPETESGSLFKPLRRSVGRYTDYDYAYALCDFTHNDADFTFTEIITPKPSDGAKLPENVVRPKNFDEQSFHAIGMHKSADVDAKVARDISNTEVLAYYPANRSEIPGWISPTSPIRANINQHFLDKAKFNLWRGNVVGDVSSWILDVVLDRNLYDIRPVQAQVDGQTVTAFVRTDGSSNQILGHLNRLISKIVSFGPSEAIGARLGIGERSNGGRTIEIIGQRPNGEEFVLSKNISDLSSGELILVSMFSDIIRIAELQGWDRRSLSDIRGLVLIDEIDVHLHLGLQMNIVGSVISLFPGIQFIFTTHSPLVALNLDKETTMLVEMPSGREVAPREFSEFGVAYEAFLNEKDKFSQELDRLAENIRSLKTPLIVTEGKTDWKHLKNALVYHQERGRFTDLSCKFHETDQTMGSAEINKMFKYFAKVNLEAPVLMVFDRDEPQYIRELSPDGFEVCGNLARMLLATPPHRKDNDPIAIEHLYLDETLMQEVPRTNKRLRFEHEIGRGVGDGSMFIRNTHSYHSHKIYDKDVSQIGLEDGSKKGELAISKNTFFEEIIYPNTEKIDFNGFIPTLERISDILSLLRK